MDSSDPKSTAPELPVMHTAVRPAPGTGRALNPSDSMRSQTALTCSSVACDCITTSMNAPRGNSNHRVYCMQEGRCKSRRHESRRGNRCERIENGGAGRNRTADKGFADLCLTTWRPRRLLLAEANHSIGSAGRCIEDSHHCYLIVSSNVPN